MIKAIKTFKPLDWVLSALVMLFIGAQVYADLALIEYLGIMIDLINPTNMPTVNTIVTTGMITLGYTLLTAVCTVVISFISSYIASRLAKRLRSMLFNKVNDFSLQEMNLFSTSSLITRSTNDITQVQMTVMMCLRLFITAPCMAVAALIKIVNKSMELTLTTAVAIVLLFATAIVLLVFVVPRFTKLQKQTDKLNLVSRENLTGLRVVRAYNAEELEEEKFEQANAELTKTQKFVNQAMAILMPFVNLIFNGVSLAIVWIGAYLIEKNTLVFADLSVFTMYAMQILMSFMMLAMLFVLLPRAMVSAKRIFQVIDTQITVIDGEGVGDSNVSSEDQGTIVFENVSFRYPNADENVLSDINLKIKKGETVAFIGSTGSGKSTLINLVPRFYDVTGGRVLVDGHDVREYKQDELHEKLGYVPQKAVLFSGTIEDNLKYSNENASEAEMNTALKIAHADFVLEDEKGLAMPVSQGGKNLSGGQKQRVSIARAIVRKPEIYIFDDSFSALDYKTDKAVRADLKEATADTTTLIVAQRIGTVRNADKIVVLDEGRMVGVGTHDELMRDSDVYREIALSQMSVEELS